MAAADFSNVPLALADASLLSCWEEKVKQGVDCSLVLKHSKGKVITIRAGPQNEKWSDRQKTENPTGSIHKEARKKKFDPKKLILMRGFAFEKYGPCSKNAQRK